MSLLRRLGLAASPGAAALDATSLDLVAELDAGGPRGDVAAGADAVWFSSWRKSELARVEPRSAEVTGRAALPGRPRALAVDARGPVVLLDDDRLVRVEPAGGEVVADAALPAGCMDVAADRDAVWLLRAGGEPPFTISLVAVDAASLAVRTEVPVGRSRFAGALQVEAGAVDTLVEDPPGEMRYAVLDSATGAPLPGDRAPRRRGIAEEDGVRWISKGDRGFRRVQIADGTVLASGDAPGPRTGAVTLAHGRLWVCNHRPPGRSDTEDWD